MRGYRKWSTRPILRSIMLTKLKDRLEDMMHTRLSWNRSRGKAAAARVEDRIEHAVEQLVVRRYGALGAAAVQAFKGARAATRGGGSTTDGGGERRRPDRSRPRSPIDPRSISDQSPIGGRGGEGRIPRVQAGRVRACPRFFEFATVSRAFSGGCALGEYNPRSKEVARRSGEVAGSAGGYLPTSARFGGGRNPRKTGSPGGGPLGSKGPPRRRGAA